MEAWFNVRLLDIKTKISFAGLDLVFCHLDLFPRNILWLDNQPPCVLDWASAGFYPRIFERCSQLITQQPVVNQVILDQNISQFEVDQVDQILKAWWNNIIYCL
jgi:thiamine kinase-like enzyme